MQPMHSRTRMNLGTIIMIDHILFPLSSNRRRLAWRLFISGYERQFWTFLMRLAGITSEKQLEVKDNKCTKTESPYNYNDYELKQA